MITRPTLASLNMRAMYFRTPLLRAPSFHLPLSTCAHHQSLKGPGVAALSAQMPDPNDLLLATPPAAAAASSLSSSSPGAGRAYVPLPQDSTPKEEEEDEAEEGGASGRTWADRGGGGCMVKGRLGRSTTRYDAKVRWRWWWQEGRKGRTPHAVQLCLWCLHLKQQRADFQAD